MAQYIKNIYTEEDGKIAGYTSVKSSCKQSNYAVYEIIDTETMGTERIVLKESKGDDMHQFDSVPTIEQALASGELTQDELNDIELNIWRKQKYHNISEWAEDINYYVKNAPNDIFLMVPVYYLHNRKERVGTLVKYYSREFSTKTNIYGSKQTASILLDDGKIIDINPYNVISVTDIAMQGLIEKYADSISAATTPHLEIASIFPWTKTDEEISNTLIDKIGEKTIGKIKSRSLLLERMRTGLFDNINKKGSHLSEEEKERIVHRMMLDYFGEDVSSVGLH